ncbi:hypothetical protein GCM10022223_36780 [Kineosporia mesophila]|uniref:Cytochrome c domain-containing protein n=1 Tax=Kineosporia mesophila TaxID=566012 RepID=A0ABP6ZQ86_9ACTN
MDVGADGVDAEASVTCAACVGGHRTVKSGAPARWGDLGKGGPIEHGSGSDSTSEAVLVTFKDLHAK